MKRLIIISLTIFVLVLCFSFWYNTPFRYITYGEAEMKRDQVAKAVKTFEKGVEKFPDNNRLLFSLARAYLQLEEIEKANNVVIETKLYKKLKTNRKFKDFLLDLAEENKRFGNDKLAQQLTRQYIKYVDINQTSARVIKNYIRAGNLLPDKALDIWEKAYNLATIINNKDLKKSVVTLIAPKYFEKAEEYVISENYSEAIELLNKAEFLTDSPKANFEKAKIYSKLNRMEFAQKEFEEAITKDTENDSYRIAYAEALEKAATDTTDTLQRKNYSEKIKLLLADSNGNPKKTSILQKIINLNADYKITNTSLFLRQVGEYTYPTLEFKIKPVTNYSLKDYKIVFLNKKKQTIDTYKSKITNDKLNMLLEVTSKNPVSSDSLVYAKLYINNEFVKEY